MPLESFAPSRCLTLGIELELQLVSTHDYDLVAAAPDLLRILKQRGFAGDVKPEITASMIEIATGVCATYGQALEQLTALRDGLLDGARRLDIGICGGGAHPFQHWGEQRISDGARFRHLNDLYGYLAKQFTIFGQHVHIGCPGPDEALLLLHGLSRFIPHLIALSASSPFVQGNDTGFDSARLNSIFAFPLSGRAPFALTWAEFQPDSNSAALTFAVRLDQCGAGGWRPNLEGVGDMTNTTCQRLVLASAITVAVFGAAACSSGTPSVSKKDVESQIMTKMTAPAPVRND